MSEILSPKVNKDAKNLFDHMFYGRLIQLESDSKEKIVFSKQVEIQKLKDQIDTFISRNPYAEFDVRILEKGSDNNDDYRVAVLFKNYKNRTERIPSRFLIVIDNAFNSVRFYQWALNNVLMPI